MTTTLQQSKLHQLSQRFVALDADTRKAFLARLGEAGIAFSELPVLAAGTHAQPISLAQQSLWLTWQLDPQSTAYNMPGVLTLDGPLDAAALLAAVADVQRRHPALCSSIDADTEPPSLRPRAPCAIELVDLGQAGEAEALRLAGVFTAAPFALDREAPFRARLYRVGPQRHLLALALHHIAADGWSLGVIVSDLVRCYEMRLAGASDPLPAPPIGPGDYALWQRRWFEAGEGERQLAYWRAALGDDGAPLALPYDHPELLAQQHPYASLRVDLPQDLSSGLRALARTRKASLYMVVQALLAWCLQRHTGQSDIRIGSPVANRTRPETQQLVAYLSNVLVLRTRIDETRGFADLLDAVRATVLDAHAHPDLPFEQLVTALQPERQPGVHPLFQVKCTEQDATPLPSAMGGATLALSELRDGASHFDLSLDFTDGADGIHLEFGYAADLFEADTIAAMAATFERLARAALADSERALGDADADCAPMPATAPSAGPATVLALWDAQVAATPDAPAVRYEDSIHTYGQLERAANALARRLQAQGVGFEARVAIHAERSAAFVLGMLAVLKAGACYVPLDPQLPRERLRFQLEDSGACLLLDSLDADWAGPVPRLALAFGDDDDGVPFTPASPHPQAAAYLIYTSGSTGTPKAVSVPHGALAAYVTGVLERLDLDAGIASMAMVSTVAADLGHTTLYGALCSGRLLHLVSAQCAFDPDRFAGYMRRHRVDVLKIVPSHLQALLAASDAAGVLPARRLVLGGEATTWPLLERIAALRPDCRVLNHYGPSETTVGVLTQEAATANRRAAQLPLGHALPSAELHVLDGALQPVPPGVAGELYIGGAGLARGYLGRPGLSAERFVANPFSRGARLYRSGDRVRRLADGALEFLGRIDDQVKIRGYRVEPGEVGRRLLTIAGVRDAYVLARMHEGRMQLAAWVVADRDAAAIRAPLAAVLPDYMLPAVLTLVERLPLNANGKVDRKALAALVPDPAHGGAAPPQGPVEETIASIWSALLKKESVGRHDNFFELGGDSIISLQIVARLRRAGYKLAPKLIFEKQTVAQLAEVVLPLSPATPQANDAPAPAADRPFALAPIQADCLAGADAPPHHRNQSLLLRPRQRLDAERLRAALASVVRRHGALRLRFARTGQAWTQRYAAFDAAAVAELLWQRSAAGMSEAEAIYQAAQRSLDIGAGPLLRAVLLDLADGSQRLLLVVHHLAVDGVSWRILLEDLHGAYAGDATGAAAGSGFEEWVAMLAGYPSAHGDELAWWRALADVPASLPAARVDGGQRGRDMAAIALRLDAARTARLLQAAPIAYRTRVNDVLLAALGRALCHWCGTTRILVALEGHGREDPSGQLDLSRTVGWFTSVVPVALASCDSPAAALKYTKEMLRAVPNGGIGHGVLRHLGGAPQRAALAALPRPQVVFNYLGQFDNSFGADAPWEPALEPAGDDVDPEGPLDYPLAINGQVHDGELALTISYSAARFDAAGVRALACRFEGELEALVAHCTSGASGLTPSDVPLAGLGQAELDGLPLVAADVEDLYPLAPMQSGMLFHDLLAPGGGAYLNQLRLDIEDVDPARLRQAWQTVLERHAVLRTGFLHARAVPLQWVARQVTLPWHEEDWRALPAERLAGALDALALAQLEGGFDLAQPPLMRLALVRTGECTHHLVWTNHHLLTDGWSTSLLLGDVLRAYQGADLGPLPGRYRDYIAWLLARDGAAAQHWWRARLAPLDSPTRLAGAMPPGPRGEGHGRARHLLGVDVTRALQAFAARERVTLNTVLQAAWALLLARHTGQSAVCFGATTAGRPAELSGAERMSGLFINTLPVVCEVDPGAAIGPWLRQLQADAVAAREQEHTPLVEIQRWAGYGGQALFDTLLVVENYPVDAALAAAPGAARFTLHGAREQTSYPLTLVLELGAQLRIEAGYARAEFGDEAVRTLLAQWETVLAAMAEGGALGNVQIEAPAMREALLAVGRNDTRYANPCPVHTLFERQAARQPQAPALLFGATTLSYGALNGRANRLAHRLIALGVGPEARVGVMLERSVEMVVALLAVMKAGGAYVPLDPEHPSERLAWMVEDSGIGLLLTTASLAAACAAPDVTVLQLDTLAPDGLPEHDPVVPLHDEHLAYVIYTSGSTGRPKGAANRHGALYNRLAWMQEAYPIGAGDTVLQKTPFGFDVSVWEFFWPLMTGARLAVAAPGAHRDPAALAAQVRGAQVSTLHFVPSMLQAFLAHLERTGSGACQSVRQVICSGEALPAEAAARLLALLPHARLYNLYGPTEAAIDVTHYTCDGDASRSVAIGRPIADTSVVVLDAALNPVPHGVAGELYLGGAGLARGYLGRAALSAERFIADPFGSDGARLYRTGDLVRWRADGQLEYLGRLDHQVKIRGLRIELGEIEACLLAQDGVSAAVVVADDGVGGARLLAYVAPAAGSKPAPAALKEALAARLPDYMVPAAIVVLERLPLNPNGKVDRKALPAPERLVAVGAPPQGELEEALARIWSGVLGLERIGREDHFFELGGHSLLALQLTARIEQELKISATLLDVFQAPTVMSYAQRLKERQGGAPTLDSLEAFIDSLD